VKLIKYLDLPASTGQGGFDHAAFHRKLGRIYVAHTANDALDVIDTGNDQLLFSVPDLKGVAGALVSEAGDRVFTSNRGEDTVGTFQAGHEQELVRIKVGIRPNGLAFDPRRGLLLAANVGNPDNPASFTLSIVDVAQGKMIGSIPVPNRTRWTIFDPASDNFYVNISEPYEIAVISAADPTRIARSLSVPAKGPHGLDFDASTNRLFCACDAGRLFTLDAASGRILSQSELSGMPDVIFFNAQRQHLYVAVGDPGVVDLFDSASLKRLEVIPTEQGAHTIGFDSARNKVYAFLPESHRAAVFLDLA
jgi:DNA-binding beta-propeller fold protein YncE